jgi:nitroimidazol reductase NimA-like FMN-containing flavoprotein (pyridoxamine 5'-phosphate oxidase superfamily)
MKELTESLKEFCEKQELLRLAYADARGVLRVVPVWFVVIEGDYFVGTDRASAKWKALERGPRAAWVIDGGSREHYKGASFTGSVEEVSDPRMRARIYRALGEKYFGSADHPGFVELYGQADNAETAYMKLKADGLFAWEY